MIRLFEEKAVDFTSLGLGALNDTISCKVTNELNGEYELEMTYPITGILYNEIKEKRIIVTKVNLLQNYEEQAFRIYLISEPIDGIVTINAHHISYDLSNIVVQPFEAKTPQEVIDKIQNGLKYLSQETFNRWHFRTTYEPPQQEEPSSDDEEKKESKMTVNKPSSLRSVLGGEGGLLETFGGELEFNNFNIIHHCKEKPIGEDRGFEVRYGSNMTTMEHKREVKNDYTAIYPYHAKTESETESEENTRYKPVYIAKNMTNKLKYTRHWLSLEKDGQAVDPEKELVTSKKPISQALQIKTEGEYQDKLVIYISDKLLNTSGGMSNGITDALYNMTGSFIAKRIFEPRQVENMTAEKYVPSNFYYKENPDDPDDDAKFILDESDTYSQDRVYYEQYIRNTDFRAGHYIEVPKKAYISNCTQDLELPASGEELDIDGNKNNNTLWLSYTMNGDPIARTSISTYMMTIPLQIQNGNAKGRMVIFVPDGSGGKYKELKNGVEKEDIEVNSTDESKTIIFDLKVFNEIPLMDTDKIKDGKDYYFGNVVYVPVTITAENYEPNKYYYVSGTEYKYTTVNSNTFETTTSGGQTVSVYYQRQYDDATKTESYSNTDIIFNSGTSYFDAVPIYALDSNDTYTDRSTGGGSGYFIKKIVCDKVMHSVSLTADTYAPDKYYYKDSNDKFVIDDNTFITQGREYFELCIMSETEEVMHQRKFDYNISQGKKYYKMQVITPTKSDEFGETVYVLADSFEEGKKYYELNSDYITSVSYYMKTPDAPLIYLNEENKDDSKVLAVDLSSNIEGDPTGELLIEAANKYIEENKDDFNLVEDSVTTEFIRLSDTLDYEFIGDLEIIQNGDKVKVIKADSNLETKLKVTSMVFDVLANTYDSIDLGAKAEDLSDTVLTNGSDISSLKNDSGYVDRAEVNHLLVKNLDAGNLKVTGLFEAIKGDITDLIVKTLEVTDLNADNIVAGNLSAKDIVISSRISIKGYEKEDFSTTPGATLAEKYVNYYGNLYIMDDDGNYNLCPTYGEDNHRIESDYRERLQYYSFNDAVFEVNEHGDLYANSATIVGHITATSGQIGDCSISEDGKLEIPFANITGELTADKIKGGTITASEIRLGTYYTPVDVSQSTYEPNTYYYIKNNIYYSETTVTASTYEPNKYYYLLNDEYVLDASTTYTEGRTYYVQESYESYELDESQSYTPNRQYYATLPNFSVNDMGEVVIRNGEMNIDKGSINMGAIYDSNYNITGYRFSLDGTGILEDIYTIKATVGDAKLVYYNNSETESSWVRFKVDHIEVVTPKSYDGAFQTSYLDIYISVDNWRDDYTGEITITKIYLDLDLYSNDAQMVIPNQIVEFDINKKYNIKNKMICISSPHLQTRYAYVDNINYSRIQPWGFNITRQVEYNNYGKYLYITDALSSDFDMDLINVKALSGYFDSLNLSGYDEIGSGTNQNDIMVYDYSLEYYSSRIPKPTIERGQIKFCAGSIQIIFSPTGSANNLPNYVDLPFEFPLDFEIISVILTYQAGWGENDSTLPQINGEWPNKNIYAGWYRKNVQTSHDLPPIYKKVIRAYTMVPIDVETWCPVVNYVIVYKAPYNSSDN